MVLEVFLNLFTMLLEFILNLIPSAPDLQNTGNLGNLINATMLLLKNSLSLFFVFVRKSTVLTVFPIVLLIINIEFVISVFKWVWSKIPFVGGK